MAYSNMAQLRMLASDVAGARAWGGRAIELAERLGATEILVHALNNVGARRAPRRRPRRAPASSRDSLALALEAGLEEDVARAHTNFATAALVARDYAARRPPPRGRDRRTAASATWTRGCST